MFTVYKVTASAGEEGERSRTVGYYTTPELAQEKAKRAGSYGSDGRVEEIVVETEADHTPAAVEARERKAALEKLTPHERKLLGLTVQSST